MRILVTNDDGVRAPGIAALAKAAAGTGHDVVVVAPREDYSGAGAAVGPVHQREGVAYETHALEGLDGTPAFGIDGPPALAVILACVGAFGARPDAVVSGINLGANVGRSAMHSGTIGAALTGAHFGLRALAVSTVFGSETVHWETAADLAATLVPVLASAPAGTVWNLNVPNVAPGGLPGVLHGKLGRTGTIRSAVQSSGQAGEGKPVVALGPGSKGMVRLEIALPGMGATAAPSPDDDSSDAAVLSRGYASLTALVGVHEAGEDATPGIELALAAMESAIARASAR
ncbi:MAG: 5'/3'-nucleotidase SurE [Actinomycetota bacterium]|nr:5'/3'-nucleotidase SurE [Actinomycetota bacterium]